MPWKKNRVDCWLFSILTKFLHVVAVCCWSWWWCCCYSPIIPIKIVQSIVRAQKIAIKQTKESLLNTHQMESAVHNEAVKLNSRTILTSQVLSIISWVRDDHTDAKNCLNLSKFELVVVLVLFSGYFSLYFPFFLPERWKISVFFFVFVFCFSSSILSCQMSNNTANWQKESKGEREMAEKKMITGLHLPSARELVPFCTNRNVWNCIYFIQYVLFLLLEQETMIT